MSATAHPLHYRPWSAPSAASRKLAVAAATAAILAAGTYEVSHLPSSAATPAAPASSTLPLTEQLIQPSALAGYTLTQPAAEITTASQWAAGAEGSRQAGLEAQQLQRLGFVAGAKEQFRARQAAAFSVVEEFASPAGARAELARELGRSVSGAAGASEFSVPGIPGVMAWQFAGRGTDAVNVAFTQGRFYYLIGGVVPPVGRGKVVGAAQLTYLLINGCVATGKTAHIPAGARRVVAPPHPAR